MNVAKVDGEPDPAEWPEFEEAGSVFPIRGGWRLVASGDAVGLVSGAFWRSVAVVGIALLAAGAAGWGVAGWQGGAGGMWWETIKPSEQVLYVLGAAVLTGWGVVRVGAWWPGGEVGVRWGSGGVGVWRRGWFGWGRRAVYVAGAKGVRAEGAWLMTEDGAGVPVRVYRCGSEREAAWVAEALVSARARVERRAARGVGVGEAVPWAEAVPKVSPAEFEPMTGAERAEAFGRWAVGYRRLRRFRLRLGRWALRRRGRGVTCLRGA